MSLSHQRRRRFLADDAPAVESPVRLAGGTDTGGAARTYADAARTARSRAVASLVPLSRMAIGWSAAAGLLLVGGCLAVHVAAAALAPWVGAEAAAPLRLDAPGSVGRWLASTLMCTAGAVAVFIYSLRRHRLDDYYGRYRMWLGVAAVCLLASLLESSGLGSLLRALGHLAAGAIRLRGDVVWPIAVASLVSAVGVRLFFEIRRSPAAVAGLVGSAIAFLVATSAYHQWPMTFRQEATPLVARGSWLVGYVLVVTTLLVYSRHVQLEVTGGEAQPSKPKRRKAKTDETGPVEAEAPRKPALRLRTDLDPVETSTSEAAQAKSPDAARSAPTVVAQPKAPTPQQLSRSERKRLKRESRMAS